MLFPDNIKEKINVMENCQGRLAGKRKESAGDEDDGGY
jgi:hypothetical protein